MLLNGVDINWIVDPENTDRVSLQVANHSGSDILWFIALHENHSLVIQYLNPAGIADGETVHLGGFWSGYDTDNPVESLTYIWYNQTTNSFQSQKGSSK